MSYNPLANVAAPPQPQGGMQGNQQQQNPLARLAGPMPGLPQIPQQPSPTRAQTVAAVHRLGAVMDAMRSVMSADGFGRTNVRPKILDEASKLLASRLLSLPEVMQSIGQVPDDPLAQKEKVEAIYNAAQQAEGQVIDHHGSAVATGKVPRDGGEKYDIGSHDRHMTGLLNHYPRV
jgi:hypothetical protein